MVRSQSCWLATAVVSLVLVSDIAARAAELPELPAAKRARFADQLGLPPYHAATLSAERPLADYFEAVVAAGGPGSLIGFDFARTYNPPVRHGAASGFVNLGGFTVTVVMILVIGLLLDAQSPGAVPEQLYAWEHWRLALAAQAPIVGLVVALLLVARRRTRRRLHEDEGIAVGPLWEAIVRRRRARRARRAHGGGDVE